MNTNDFYKELFEKYALDEDKIRRNAIKAAKTPAWQRAVGAHWRSVAGAAAAVAVTVGVVAYTVGNGQATVDITSSDTLLTAAQRLRAAEQNYFNTASEDNDVANIYVSFLEDLCYSDMLVSLSALPDYDDIEIQCLYLSDSSVIRGKSEIDAFIEANSDKGVIAGAKLCAPLRCYKDIYDLSKVFAAELGSEDINDDTFSPLHYDDSDPLSNANDFVITTAAPEVTTAPFVFVSETTTEASDVTDDTTQPTEDEDDPEYIEPTDDPAETSDGSEDPEVTEAPETFVSESEAPASSESEAETTVTSEEFPDAPAVGLMTQIYQLNVENSIDTILIGDHAAVLTRNEVYLYKIGGLISSQGSVYEISNPKAVSTDNDMLVLTGCSENGIRNVLVTIDFKTGSILKNEAESILGTAEIGPVQYSRADGKYFMKAVSASNTYLYELNLGEDGMQFRPLFEFEGAVSVAGYKNGKLWFTAANEGLKYDLYSFGCADGTLKKEFSFGSECKVRRSRTFESFLINASDEQTDEPVTYVVNVSTGNMVAVNISGDASVADNRGAVFVGIGDKNYSVADDGTLTETKSNIIYSSKPESSFGVVSADAEKVVVAEKENWLRN